MTEPTVNIAKTIGDIFLAIGGASGIAALVGEILNWRGKRANAKKTEQETEHIVHANATEILAGASGDIATQYRGLLEDYQKTTDAKIAALHCELGAVKGELGTVKEISARYLKRIQYLMAGIQSLSEQVIGLGHEPCFSPTPWDPTNAEHKSD